jgi:hypothetical protein
VANGWISVADRLPDNDQPVLVWNSGGYCLKPWAWWQICDYRDGKWREQDERDEYPGVTHWMPLPPEPPNWKPIFEPPTDGK